MVFKGFFMGLHCRSDIADESVPDILNILFLVGDDAVGIPLRHHFQYSFLLSTDILDDWLSCSDAFIDFL